MTSPVANTESVQVEVIVPCFNTPGEYLEKAVRSALAQRCVRAVRVQDGGSTRSDTMEALAKIATWSLVDVVIQYDEGQSDALNRALDRVQSDWILWLNADDLIEPGSVDQLAEAAISSDIDFVYGNYRILDADGTITREFQSSPWSRRRIFRRGCYIFSGSILMRYSSLRELGSFDASLSYAMDLDLQLRAATHVRTLKVETTVGALRIHGESKTGSGQSGFIHEARAVRVRHSRGVRERTLAYLIALETGVYIRAQPIRFSRLYGQIRGLRRV